MEEYDPPKIVNAGSSPAALNIYKKLKILVFFIIFRYNIPR